MDADFKILKCVFITECGFTIHNQVPCCFYKAERELFQIVLL